MKKSLAFACIGLITVVAPTAQAELSANIGVTTNYLWRGVTQSDNGPAVSGGVDYVHESGFYLGTWVSTINWANFGIDKNGSEVDFYGGFSGESNDFGYDIGLIHYMYLTNGYEDSDFTEFYTSLAYGPVKVGLAYTIDADWVVHDNLYYYLSASHELKDGWRLGGTIGHYSFEGSGSDYSHLQLDLTKSTEKMGDFTLTLSKATKNSGDDGAMLVASWGMSF